MRSVAAFTHPRMMSCFSALAKRLWVFDAFPPGGNSGLKSRLDKGVDMTWTDEDCSPDSVIVSQGTAARSGGIWGPVEMPHRGPGTPKGVPHRASTSAK